MATGCPSAHHSSPTEREREGPTRSLWHSHMKMGNND
ncbi:hypothetical protein BVRB_6g137350 [Beta vulgaris subsp. vulgaris]|nr:hypothetical protein BVRB_6g137350 [Beta vulgaris subsp. vulgaris]